MTGQPMVRASGAEIPKLGFGTWKLKGEDATSAVETALSTGYRHIDTAQVYENEGEVGAALRTSGVAREDVFVTTKVWMDRFAAGDLEDSVKESLARLDLDHVDLVLLHWPNPDFPLAETIGALNEARSAGLTRHIGVSNFTTAWLGEAVACSDAPLAANQVEYHPFLDQTPVMDALKDYAMALTAYCPIAQGRVFEAPVLKDIAEKHGKSPAQIALKWLINQDPVAAIPRSSRPEHIRSNFDIFDIDLSDEEMARIGALKSSTNRLIDPGWAPAWDVAA